MTAAMTTWLHGAPMPLWRDEIQFWMMMYVYMIRVTMSSKILQWRRGDGGVGAGAFDQFAAGIAIALVAPGESLLRLRPSEQRHVPLEPVAVADARKNSRG